MRHFIAIFDTCVYLNKLPYIKKNGEEFKEYPTIKMTYNAKYNYFRLENYDKHKIEIQIIEYKSEERFDYLVQMNFPTEDGYTSNLLLFKTIEQMEHCFEFVNTPLSSECYAECFTIIDYINSNEFHDYVTLIYIDNELYVLKHNFNKLVIKNNLVIIENLAIIKIIKLLNLKNNQYLLILH
jgi:hypothetical protein